MPNTHAGSCGATCTRANCSSRQFASADSSAENNFQLCFRCSAIRSRPKFPPAIDEKNKLHSEVRAQLPQLQLHHNNAPIHTVQKVGSNLSCIRTSVLHKSTAKHKHNADGSNAQVHTFTITQTCHSAKHRLPTRTWPCIVLNCDFHWDAGCVVTYRSLNGDVLDTNRWSVGTFADSLERPCRSDSVVT